MRTVRALRGLRQSIGKKLEQLNIPRPAKVERLRDLQGLPTFDPGIEPAVRAAVAWLCRAQDHSTSRDGGSARHFSLISGWSTSYPETTGYIVPTLLDFACRTGDDALRSRAKKMLDWLVSIQYPDGAFQGGRVDSIPKVRVTFNTGQILFGLASGVKHLSNDYTEPMRRAAHWLVDVQDADGAWRNHLSPFAPPGEHTYETHVAFALLEAAQVDPTPEYVDAAVSNVNWAMSLQEKDGWLEKCSLSVDQMKPLTHSLGYGLRGILEAHRYTRDSIYLEAGKTLAGRLMDLASEDGFVPGVIDREWRGAVPWACLTGTVQIAHCWLMVYLETGDVRFRDAGFRANRYVRRSIRLDAPPSVQGGVKGSFPVDGDYCRYEFPSWAAKFFIDSNLLELDIRNGVIRAPRSSS